MSDLKDRVDKFNALELPGQPKTMHMGTSRLVADLWREIERLRAENQVLRNVIIKTLPRGGQHEEVQAHDNQADDSVTENQQ